MNPSLSRVTWEKTYRIINSCYPLCDIWEDICEQPDWYTLFYIADMTNPRLRQEMGGLFLIPQERMVTGKDSWWVVSTFAHILPSRFNDHTYGVYYAANQFLTGIKEKAFGLTKKFMAATNEPIQDITCRVLVGRIDRDLHDIRDKENWPHCYLGDDYSPSQAFARELRNQDSNGIVYKSVRDENGECFAAFWPDVISIPIQERHVVLHWNGETIVSYFEVKEKQEKRMPL